MKHYVRITLVMLMGALPSLCSAGFDVRQVETRESRLFCDYSADDPGRIFSISIKGDLSCHDAESGALLAARDLDEACVASLRLMDIDESSPGEEVVVTTFRPEVLCFNNALDKQLWSFTPPKKISTVALYDYDGIRKLYGVGGDGGYWDRLICIQPDGTAGEDLRTEGLNTKAFFKGIKDIEIGNVTDDHPGPEICVMDTHGLVHVYAPDGTLLYAIDDLDLGGRTVEDGRQVRRFLTGLALWDSRNDGENELCVVSNVRLDGWPNPRQAEVVVFEKDERAATLRGPIPPKGKNVLYTEARAAPVEFTDGKGPDLAVSFGFQLLVFTRADDGFAPVYEQYSQIHNFPWMAGAGDGRLVLCGRFGAAVKGFYVLEAGAEDDAFHTTSLTDWSFYNRLTDRIAAMRMQAAERDLLPHHTGVRVSPFAGMKNNYYEIQKLYPPNVTLGAFSRTPEVLELYPGPVAEVVMANHHIPHMEFDAVRREFFENADVRRNIWGINFHEDNWVWTHRKTGLARRMANFVNGFMLPAMDLAVEHDKKISFRDRNFFYSLTTMQWPTRKMYAPKYRPYLVFDVEDGGYHYRETAVMERLGLNKMGIGSMACNIIPDTATGGRNKWDDLFDESIILRKMVMYAFLGAKDYRLQSASKYIDGQNQFTPFGKTVLDTFNQLVARGIIEPPEDANDIVGVSKVALQFVDIDDTFWKTYGRDAKLRAWRAAAPRDLDGLFSGWKAYANRSESDFGRAAYGLQVFTLDQFFQTPYGIVPLDYALDEFHDSRELIGHWTFESETIEDASNKKLIATPHGVRIAPEGVRHRCAAFDGEGSWIEVAPRGSVRADTLTLSAWIRVRAGDRARQILDAGSFSLGLNGDMELEAVFDTRADGGRRSMVAAAWPAELNDTWAHVAATYNGRAPRLYVNGQSVGSRQQANRVPAGIDPVEGPLFIGRPHDRAEAFFAGHMDDVRLYDMAMNDAQIRSLYLEYKPRYTRIFQTGGAKIIEDGKKYAWDARKDEVLAALRHSRDHEMEYHLARGEAFTVGYRHDGNKIRILCMDPNTYIVGEQDLPITLKFNKTVLLASDLSLTDALTGDEIAIDENGEAEVSIPAALFRILELTCR
jgi:FAD/FMN-containing dehydrogenase